MSALRALRLLVLGETWMLPGGIAAIVVLGALVHHLASQGDAALERAVVLAYETGLVEPGAG